MIEEKIKLNDVYADWLTNGIFKQLDSFDVPWKDHIDGSIIDLDYHGNRSGSKIISPLIYKLLDNNVLSDERQLQIATLIWKKYGTAWTKSWMAINEEYNPFDNYKLNKREEEDKTLKIDGTKTIDDTTTDSGTIDKTNTGTVNTKDDETVQLNGDTTSDGDTNNSIFGFNSSSASPSDNSSTNQTTNTDQTTTGNRESIVTDNRNELLTRDLTIVDKITDVDDKTHKTDGVLTSEIYGHIGGITSQQMLESELKLRFDWKFFDLVYSDVDNILTINIF